MTATGDAGDPHDSPAAQPDVAIVGAGISGLAAAFELQQQGLTFRLLEARSRPGGVVLTEHIDGFVVDAGPDSLLAQKPAALALCEELGLTPRLCSTRRPRTAYIYRGGHLHPIPEASILGFPTRLRPLATSSLFTWTAKCRMAAEILFPPWRSSRDESIAAFVKRHFGREAVEYVAEPLLAGIHAGDVDRLSIRAAFPRLVEAETRRGSIIRAFAGRMRRADPEGAFRSLPDGIGELIDTLVSRLPDDVLQCGGTVDRVVVDGDDQEGPSVEVHQAGHAPLRARAVLLAMPAWAAADVLDGFDTEIAALCRGIRYWSTATVALAFPEDAIGRPLSGSGFVVPRTEDLTITAGSWVSSKWPHRAPPGRVLLRAFLGGARDPEAVTRSDGELVDSARADFGRVLDIRTEPDFARVYRWHRASPQQEVGHLDRMASIDRGLARWPQVFLTGTGLRGVGIPDCIADGRATARKIVQTLAS